MHVVSQLDEEKPGYTLLICGKLVSESWLKEFRQNVIFQILCSTKDKMFCTDITFLIIFFTWKVSLRITIFLVTSEKAETGEGKRQRRERNDFEKSEDKLSQQKSIFAKLS